MKEWLTGVADELLEIHKNRLPYICRKEIYGLVVDTVNTLYPSRCDQEKTTKQDWCKHLEAIDEQLISILEQLGEKNPENHAKIFLESIPALKSTLDQDAEYFREQDPASDSVLEIVVCYPGFLALVIHRIAHQLYEQGVDLLPRIIAEYAHERTGVDIHPGAKLASPIFIDHGTGIVIGETCEIGHHVNIFQGVTLGAHSVKKSMQGTKRHPKVGNHVILYSNATILGGATEIGDHSVVGGNVWITKSIPEGSQIYYEQKG